MYIILVGLNHKTAPIEVREKCAFGSRERRAIYAELKADPSLRGAAILVTCNRTEIYATAPDVRYGLSALENILKSHSGITRPGFTQHIYQHFSYHAVSQLFSVTAGLDSMVLGEHQIVGQIRDAYQEAADAGATDSTLNILFQSALRVGRKVRTATGINRYPVSVSSAAVELCRDIFGTLTGKKVLVLGAGETGELTVRHLMSGGVQTVIVANRTYEHAVSMARMISGRAVHFDRMPAELSAADIVIGCTAAPHFIVRSEECAALLRTRRGREIVLIDIAVPRDIDPALGQIGGVFLYDIDDLQNVVEANHKERLKAAHRGRDIIESETAAFAAQLATRSMVPLIRSLKDFAEAIKDQELEKALSRMEGLSARDEKIVGALAHTIVSKLLHTPFERLKQKAAEDRGGFYAEIARDLFGLQPEDAAVRPETEDRK